MYANAKLVKEGYDENVSVADFIKTVEEYDEAIKSEKIDTPDLLYYRKSRFIRKENQDFFRGLSRFHFQDFLMQL